MSNDHVPAGLPADYRLTVLSSQQAQEDSKRMLVRADGAIMRSRLRLKRSAERMVCTNSEATTPDAATENNPE